MKKLNHPYTEANLTSHRNIPACMMILPSQVLLSFSLVTLGSALRCYYCMPSCLAEPTTCAYANETYCLSMRSRPARSSENVFIKSCANQDMCRAAHHACEDLKKNATECHALCCEKNLCNLHHDPSNAVINSLPVYLTVLALLLHLSDWFS